VISSSRAFSARLYPRAAIESAALGFKEICEVRLEHDPDGTRVTLALPADAGEDLMDEFCNLALTAAVEIHLRSAI
jgi:hypothetical protein